jgi:hypothetical protein
LCIEGKQKKMEDKNILEMIKSQDSKKALKEMEEKFKEILLNKLDSDLETNSFMQILDCSIKNFPENYDILTYLRNIYFFEEKTDSEKLYELAYIYENLVQE